jgi:hypothetical protein
VPVTREEFVRASLMGVWSLIYPFHERRKQVGLANAVAEVTYPYTIPQKELSGLSKDSWSRLPVE